MTIISVETIRAKFRLEAPIHQFLQIFIFFGRLGQFERRILKPM